MSMKSKRRPIIFMPTWDVRLANLFNRRNYPCVGIGSNVKYDMVVFVDGPPVSPIFYGEAKLATMKCDLARDRYESQVFRQLKTKIPKLGIGRGAHLLNIMNGGSAWQFVSNHIGPHKTTCLLTGNESMISSNHSQLMLPRDDADLICVADVARTFQSDSIELRRESMKDAIDVEVCYYDHTNSLCFQPDAQHGHEGTITYLETLMHECLILGDNSKTCEP